MNWYFSLFGCLALCVVVFSRCCGRWVICDSLVFMGFMVVFFFLCRFGFCVFVVFGGRLFGCM